MRVVTHSELRCYRSCARKHFYKYNQGYRTLTQSETLRFGILVHHGLEQLWSGQELTIESEDEFELAKATATLDGYAIRWDMDPVVAVEAEFTVPIINPETGCPSKTYKLGGKIDVITGGPTIVEHKTTSMDISKGSDYWSRLTLDQQINGYFLGAAGLGYETDRCMYDVIRRPGMRPFKVGKRRKVEETPEEYGERIRADIIKDPDKYYQRGTVVRLGDQMKEAQWDLWQVTKLLRESELSNRWPRNSEQCLLFGKCSYFDVCCGHADIADPYLFRKAERTHEELSNETQ